MNDPEIRQILIKHFHQKYPNQDNSLVLEEVGILHGSTITDIALFSKVFNHAFEIKSSQDNLKRLESQLKDYVQVFDYISIVTQPSHLDELLCFLPPFVGIILAYDNGHLELKRSPVSSPYLQMKKLVHLLWKDEIYQFLKSQGKKGFSTASYAKLRKELLNYSDKEIRELIFKSLKERQNWKKDFRPF